MEIGSTIDGGFAEYFKVPKQVFEIGGIVPVPEEVSNEEASLIEPLACCINGINQIKHSKFESAIIIGDGPVGLMQLMLLKRIFNGLNITIIGKISHRLEAARKLGADAVIMIKDELDEKLLSSLKEIKGQKPPNLIFVSNNNPNSLNLALRLVNKAGEIVIFSGIKKVVDKNLTNLMSIDPNTVHYDQISIHGSFSSTPSNLGEAMNLVKNNEIEIKDLVTHLFSLEEFKNALSAAESFTGLKSIINKF
jgi:L-iditol 2-dehydrogenase